MRKETLAICTTLDPRFKNFTFVGAKNDDKEWAYQIVKATFEDKWSALPLAPVPVAATPAAVASAVTTAAVVATTTSARPVTTLAAAAPAGASSSTFADIFSRPMEEEEASEDDEALAGPAIETDLDKYLKLPELPITQPDGTQADILSWWKQRDHSLPANPQTSRPEGLPRLARMARQYHGEPASSGGAERLFSAASRAHHDLKGAMADNSLEHELLALANTE